MQVSRLQMNNYGPIENLDIAFPYDGDIPIPVVLVGENGSGKSILLSHIVNGLIMAQSRVYPDAAEVETGRVFKLRSGSYIRSGSEYYFVRTDFSGGLFVEEVRTRRIKREYETPPDMISEGESKRIWEQMDNEKDEHLGSNIFKVSEHIVRANFEGNCVLYFPPNRFEEPAWLNEDNLKYRAEFVNPTWTRGNTVRKVINYSSLRENQNWLYDIIYDSSSFDLVRRNALLPEDNGVVVQQQVIVGSSGRATDLLTTTRQIIQTINLENSNVSLRVGPRQNRTISLVVGNEVIVPNVFQLSSGQTSLLNLFLTILRDFDFSGSGVVSLSDVKGIAIVDEVDVHLHTRHQYEILPALIKLFPKVQFIVTTHSPLFILGIEQALVKMVLRCTECRRASKSALRNSPSSEMRTVRLRRQASFRMTFAQRSETLRHQSCIWKVKPTFVTLGGPQSYLVTEEC